MARDSVKNDVSSMYPNKVIHGRRGHHIIIPGILLRIERFRRLRRHEKNALKPKPVMFPPIKKWKDFN